MLKQMPSWKKDQPSVHKIKTNTPTKNKVFVSSHRWLRAAITSPTSYTHSFDVVDTCRYKWFLGSSQHSVSMAMSCLSGFSQEQQQAQGCSGMLPAPHTCYLAFLLGRIPNLQPPSSTPSRTRSPAATSCLPPSYRHLKSNSA